jgi:hypothetical protein
MKVQDHLISRSNFTSYHKSSLVVLALKGICRPVKSDFFLCVYWRVFMVPRTTVN